MFYCDLVIPAHILPLHTHTHPPAPTLFFFNYLIIYFFNPLANNWSTQGNRFKSQLHAVASCPSPPKSLTHPKYSCWVTRPTNAQENSNVLCLSDLYWNRIQCLKPHQIWKPAWIIVPNIKFDEDLSSESQHMHNISLGSHVTLCYQILC